MKEDSVKTEYQPALSSLNNKAQSYKKSNI